MDTESTNALVTGPPRSGKTTALERTVSTLRAEGYAVAGLSSPEIRSDGRRVGFELVDLASDRRAVMAHVDRDSGPSVGKYRVDVAAVDRIAGGALPVDSDDPDDPIDCIVVDEIAPMQLESERFIATTRRALESPIPVLAAIKAGTETGFVGEVKSRADAALFEVDPATRDEVPDRLTDWVRTRV